MDEATRLLEQAEALLARVVTLPVRAFTDPDLLDLTRRVEGVGRRVDSLRASTAAEIAERSRRDLGEAGLARRLGHARPAHLVEQVTASSSGEAGRRIRLGTAVAERTALDGHAVPSLFPVVGAALAAGRIGAEAAAHIVRALSQAADRAHPADLASAEAGLVEAATTGASADLIADQAAVWRDHLDTDGVAPRFERQLAARRFTLGRERDDGMTPFSGLADPLSAGRLRAALAAHRRKPAFAITDPPSGAAGADAGASEPPDGRTFEQRDFDILFGLIIAGIDSDDSAVAGGRSSVVATVTLEQLRRREGVAWLDGVRDAIPVATIDELVCDSGYEVAVTGANGSLTALTTKQQFFTRAQRRALAARDGGCVWPGCSAPSSWTDAHHVVHREHGGPTAVSNGVLLCPAHHHFLHAGDHRLRMVRGRPHLLAPPRLDPEQRWVPVGKSRLELTARIRDGDPGPPSEVGAA